jgi:hypothetical protein
MLYAAIDIHKHAFQAAVFDPESGEVVQARFSADRESLSRCADEWRGRVDAVAIEATTGWRPLRGPPPIAQRATTTILAPRSRYTRPITRHELAKCLL